MSDLDSFFKKKDQKKKSKKGFAKANTDILAKNLEEQDRKEAKADERAAVPLATSEANKAQAAIEQKDKVVVEEEWKDYDDEKKDYSNLKIEALKVESGDENSDEEVEHEINEEGEKVPVKKSDGGPWNRIQPEGSSAAGESGGAEGGSGGGETDRKSQREMAKAELESSIGAPKGSVVGGSYVPPHMRGGSGGGGGSSSTSSATQSVQPTRGGPRRTKHAPDISSEIYFPSLSAAGSSDQGRATDERDFEEVKARDGSGGQHYSSRAAEAPRLALDNKFAALRN